MAEELKTLLDASPILLLMTPSLVTGLLLIFFVYKLASGLGNRFLENQSKQTDAFLKIATSMESLKDNIEKNARLQDDIRITITAMSGKIDHIYNNTRGRGEQ